MKTSGKHALKMINNIGVHYWYTRIRPCIFDKLSIKKHSI